METKYVRVPFEVELAKKITDKSVEGRIVTRNGRNARIICFDAKSDDNIIALIEDKNGLEFPKSYVSDGRVFLTGECDADLMLEIPEYMTFKDGDVIIFGNSKDSLSIGVFNKQTSKSTHKCYVKFDIFSNIVFDVDGLTYNNARKAIKEEKQQLIDALKASKEPKAKEHLKRFFGIEVKQEYEFKPFDKVLVRDNYKDSKWGCDLFSHKKEDGLYVCIGEIWENCIPYEGNEHLLGTTEKYE